MLNSYINTISEMKNFEKNDIICDKFTIEQSGTLQIVYAPHNEYINSYAKILVVGICPGWTQTQIAYKTAYDGIKKELSVPEIQRQCKINSRFAGSMRKNLISFMNELNIHHHLGLSDCKHLFDENCTLLHTTSLIPFPVFINGKNYTGHNPELSKNVVLNKYIEKYFYTEAKHFSDCLIIPLGKSVDEALTNMVQLQLLNPDNILFGFPHTSGANGHRKKQFDDNKEKFSVIIKNYFNDK